ncbi:MAG: GHKL domain-containing protein [Oscillospiraceae bacterium]
MMYAEIIKYFTIIITSFYLYHKLLNKIEETKKKRIAYLACALLLSVVTGIIKSYAQYLAIPIMILVAFIMITLLSGTKLELSLSSIIISFAISYGINTLASVIIALLFFALKISHGVSYIYPMLLILPLQVVFATIPFKFKRLKKGMPFLIKGGASDVGVLLSLVVLCAIIVLNDNNARFIYIIPVLFIIICSVLVLLWWRKRITKIYKERLRTAEVQCLQDTIAEKDQRIDYLTKQNDSLSKIIHKDNKLIPAMELAVRKYLTSVNASDEETNKTGESLLAEFETLSNQRLGIIGNYQNKNKVLPLTGVFSVDTLLNYMLSKATNNDISFDFTLTGSVKFMIDNVIKETDLNTLLADLIENAIVATKKSSNKQILINIGVADGIYFMDVIDSGIMFETDTLCKLGLKKATTHANEGGSGIGLLSIFELCKKTKASLCIKEFSLSKQTLFTKRISVLFDEKRQYIIDSPRSESLMKKVSRTDVLFTNTDQ